MATPASYRDRPGEGDHGNVALARLATDLAAALEEALLAARLLQRALGGGVGDLREPAMQPGGASCPTDGKSPGCGGLSRREAEVLGLLAAGRSNRQIASALCLSPRTVQRHVANAYLKIGAHNKADATAYVLRMSSRERAALSV